jgi:hypothetical protein
VVTEPTPGRAGRDPQAEQDHAEFTGWWEAQGYDADHAQTFYGADVMAETFLAGMQAQRDLVAAQEPRAAPGKIAARHAAEAGLPPEAAAILAQAVPELATALDDFNFEHNQVIELRAVVLDMARSIRASMNGGGRIARSEVIDWTARAGVEFDIYAEPDGDQ